MLRCVLKSEDRQKANLPSVVSMLTFSSKEGKADILNFDEFEGKIKPTTVHLSKTKFEKTSCDVIWVSAGFWTK